MPLDISKMKTSPGTVADIRRLALTDLIVSQCMAMHAHGNATWEEALMLAVRHLADQNKALQDSLNGKCPPFIVRHPEPLTPTERESTRDRLRELLGYTPVPVPEKAMLGGVQWLKCGDLPADAPTVVEDPQ